MIITTSDLATIGFNLELQHNWLTIILLHYSNSSQFPITLTNSYSIELHSIDAHTIQFDNASTIHQDT